MSAFSVPGSSVRGSGRPGWRTDPAAWFIRRVGLARASVVMTALGTSLAALTSIRPAWALTGVGCGLMGTVAVLAVRRSRGTKRAAGSALLVALLVLSLSSGSLIGALRAATISESSLRAYIGTSASAELVVTGDVRRGNGWQSAMAVIRSFKCGEEAVIQAQGEKVWLEVPPSSDYVTQPQLPVLQEGVVLRAVVKVREPKEESSSGYNERRRLLCEGVTIVLRARPESVNVLGQRGGISGWLDSLRRGVRSHLEFGPDDRIDAALKGVVLGDTSEMDPEWLESFRRAGTAHMFAVSGLHVGSVAGMAIGLAQVGGLVRWASYVLGAGAAALMVVFVGASASCLRAAVMITLMVAAQSFGRRRDSWQILALAAVLVLGLNPFAIYDAGFQLSFAAVAGILAFAGPLQRRLSTFSWLPGAIRANLSVSVAAALGTGPVALWAFGRTSLVSPLANLLVVPLLPTVVGLGLASGFAGFAWHGLSVFLDHLTAVALAWIVTVSRLFGAAPVLNVGGLGEAACALAGRAVMAPFILALLGHVPRIPGKVAARFLATVAGKARGWRRRRPRLVAACAAALLVAGALGGGFSYLPLVRGVAYVESAFATRNWPPYPEVTVLDVGQGNAVLLRIPGHKAFLFDAGPADCGLAEKLRSLGVRRLDALIVSHPHADHFAGAAEALRAMDIDLLVDCVEVACGVAASAPRVSPVLSSPGRPSSGEATSADAQAYSDFRALLDEKGCRHLTAQGNEMLDLAGVGARLFAPTQPLLLHTAGQAEKADLQITGVEGSPSSDAVNASSLVVLLSVGEVDVLLPGDAEAETLFDYDLPPVEVLVVPHHGSRGAVSRLLLKRLSPQIAVISVGKNNDFGHPSPETLSLLRDAGVTVMRTDTCGQVCCLLKGDHLEVTCERQATGERSSVR